MKELLKDVLYDAFVMLLASLMRLSSSAKLSSHSKGAGSALYLLGHGMDNDLWPDHPQSSSFFGPNKLGHHLAALPLKPNERWNLGWMSVNGGRIRVSSHPHGQKNTH